ncbi:MAG: hypothetical protein HY398_00735 [Candidatus Doudnabacteria bacterium]|nr:hypothetical protein [Candidatus Doudnabacteria bacterium]
MTEDRKQYIVGINLPMKSRCHESGVALLDMEGSILFAINEERLSRKKQDGDFPEKSIAAMFAHTGIKKEEIAVVAVPTLSFWGKVGRVMQFLWRERRRRMLNPATYFAIWRVAFGKKRSGRLGKSGEINQEQDPFMMRYQWRDFIKKNFPNAKIKMIDHHLCHAASAYYTSPWENALIITADGAGNMLSSIVAVGEKGRIRILDKTFVPHSPGSFWGSITKVCGFRSGTRHGGKTTGLAAAGDPNKLIYKMRQIISCDGIRFHVREELLFDPQRLIPNWSSYEPERLKNFLGENSREDVAAAAQKRLEEIIVELVRNARKVVPFDKVVMAGGTFANVLVNEKVLELPGIDDVYICPAMSDGGLAVGAALYTLSRIKKFLPRPIGNVYLGPKYSEGAIKNYLEKIGAKFELMNRPATKIAELIHNNKVVAFYQGRMEWGPRALGNRSILYAAKDPKVNDWLNKKLRRSEFMPFAPVTLIEHIKDCYIGIADDPLAAKYMTITYQCTDQMKRESPACAHLDGTARPQVIKREDNPYYYDILSEYHKLSGIPTIINTSFNMHEEPIVCQPEDAVRAFLDSGLDCLVMENYLLRLEENEPRSIQL